MLEWNGQKGCHKQYDTTSHYQASLPNQMTRQCKKQWHLWCQILSSPTWLCRNIHEASLYHKVCMRHVRQTAHGGPSSLQLNLRVKRSRRKNYRWTGLFESSPMHHDASMVHNSKMLKVAILTQAPRSRWDLPGLMVLSTKLRSMPFTCNVLLRNGNITQWHSEQCCMMLYDVVCIDAPRHVCAICCDTSSYSMPSMVHAHSTLQIITPYLCITWLPSCSRLMQQRHHQRSDSQQFEIFGIHLWQLSTASLRKLPIFRDFVSKSLSEV